MTREEANSCIRTIEMLVRLAYNIHGVMDVIDAENCETLLTQLKESPENFNKDSAPESMLNADLISRQAAIDSVRGSIWAQNHIKNLPSVKPQKVGRWISVDEQLPEETGTYLVTLKFDDLYESIVTSVAEYDDGRWDMLQLFVGNVPKIIYWMPLPEPYKAESEDKE